MIELQNIEVIFNKGTKLENKVLKGINLSVNEGEFITVIGGNGAGKSTLMNVLAGEIIPNSGKILIDNKDVTKLSVEDRSSMVARILQDPMIGTFADLTIEENMSIASKRGQKRGLSKCITKELLDKSKVALSELGIGLENRLNDKVASLSGGQRQALSLIMATLEQSKLLLLDEHTAALDPKIAKAIMILTDNIIKEHKLTALMITHSMSQALEYGTRTIMMYQGNIVKDMQGHDRNTLSPNELIEFFDL